MAADLPQDIPSDPSQTGGRQILELSQTRKMPQMLVILVDESCSRGASNPESLVEEGVIDLKDHALFWLAETAEPIWRDILHWYELNAESLCLAHGPSR